MVRLKEAIVKRFAMLGVLLAVLCLGSSAVAGIVGGQRSVSTTEYTAVLSISGTTTGTYYDLEGGHEGEWEIATITVSGLTGAGATIWIDCLGSTTMFDESGQAVAPDRYNTGVQYGLAIVANGVYHTGFLPRFIKIRVEDWTAGVVLVVVRLHRP